ncbi:MAG: hypothetical protein IPN70_00440 [Candidatus Moraniibacteriota bacterium]|nr:MAG: hypothetical protein IPN70_00440 [Candidatus Moranbacteria bacterium]
MNNRLSLVLVAIIASGCAPMTPRESLGLSGGEMEYLANATTFVAPPPIHSAKGYEVSLPKEVKREVMCKQYMTLDKKQVEICRKAFRARVSGQNISLYPKGEKGYVFSSSEFRGVEVISARGKAYMVPVAKELSASELRDIYAHLGGEFPFISDDIPGSGARLLFGEDALNAVSVPSLVDWKERSAICGLGSISSSDILGPIMYGPIGALPKVLQIGCALLKEPNLLEEKKESSKKEEKSSGGYDV